MDFFRNLNFTRSVILLSLVGLIAAYGFLKRGWRRILRLSDVPVNPFWMNVLIVVLLLPAVAVVWGVVQNITAGTGEPAYLAEGVSMWPTEALRILAAIASVVLMYVAIAQIRDCDRKLGDLR